ncbi:MAG: sugar ABC transporter permease, partial [Phycisphaerae bacterium]|nr:sugar ABC transporter permease [Phycisphaerae bacterium]
EDAWNEPLFWNTFKLVGILLAANLVKMWPCIFAAVVLHRLRNERWQYIYRVMLVIPMVIPAIVTLLIWKSFYDPTSGILNSVFQATGVMTLLQKMDTFMPALAKTMVPIRDATVGAVFGNSWAMGIFGLAVLSMLPGWKNLRKRWVWLLALAASMFFVAGGSLHFLKCLVTGQVLMPFTAYRPLLLVLVVAMIGTFLSKGFVGPTVMKWIGGLCITIMSGFVLTTMIWDEPSKAFMEGTPAWLGSTHLIIPALIFWGFPWVGIIGVLIYLAGLQNISSDVYEAAELDGVGPFGKLFKIELPLILSQVRINLIFMTIGTLTGYGMFLLMLGPEGGPGNKGMVPGLYMFREAFFNQKYGYACALGMVMFVIVLSITIFYQKYVKVEK